MAKNDELLHQEARSLASQSRIKYFDLVIAQGNGALLTDADGKEYIDLLASASSTNTGHCHPSVVQAITQQAQKLIQYTPAYFANQIAAQLSTRLTKLAPMSGPVKLAWGNSGSDANDAIIKFARTYTGRQYIVTFTGAYHGSTYGSLTASGVSLNMTRKLGPLLPGIIKAPTKYLQKVYEFAHEHGILFAVDEVNQGMGRTGKWWSIQHFELEPDLMSVGKSLASGLPLSAVIGRAEIMEALDAPAHIFTTAGNPLTAAAALATIEIIEKEELLRRSTELGRSAATFFQQAQAKYDFIGNVRMYGLNGGIDIIDPKTKKPSTEIATKIIHRAFELGVIMISLRGNILRFQPPLVITTAQLEQAFAILEQVFSEEAAGKLQLPKNAAELGW